MQELVFDQKERIGAWVAEQVEQTASWGSFYAMGVERDGEIVAGIVLNNFNGANATGHFATVKFGKAFVELVRHFFDYCFNKCGLLRVTGMMPASNEKAIAFTHKLGFEDEFVMPKGAPDGEDMLFVVMWPDKCRWLRR